MKCQIKTAKPEITFRHRQPGSKDFFLWTELQLYAKALDNARWHSRAGDVDARLGIDFLVRSSVIMRMISERL